MADVKAIVSEIPGVEAAAPNASSGTQSIYGNLNWSTSITGSTNDFLKVRNWTLASGMTFTASEAAAGKAVCILGNTVKKELFGAQDPIGSSIRLKKLSCQVIGVLEPKGSSGFGSDQDDFILIPIKTFMRRIAGDTDVPGIYVSARDGYSTDKVKKDIENLMRERRRIAPGKDDDFNVRDMKEILSTLTGTTKVLTSLLGAVAAVSLLVGGDRNHEHHAGVRDRKNTGDRNKACHRRSGRGSPHAVSHRSRGPVLLRRRGRNRPGVSPPHTSPPPP